MTFSVAPPGLSDNAFVILRDLIHERTGLQYENGKAPMLLGKLADRVLECGFQSFLDYYYLLKYDTAADQEWGRLMDALSVPETYFWREMDQVRTLVEVVVPRHFQQRPGEPLRIWSAACCTGEEPLSIALALHEAGWFERAPIEILASDASPAAIEKARRGRYRERSFRALPAELRARYFRAEPDGWQIAPQLHRRVTWSVANLQSPSEIDNLAKSRVIFCRNVFIYFSTAAIRKTIQVFFRQMPMPGYLFTASAESLLRVTADFELQELGGAFVYVKASA